MLMFSKFQMSSCDVGFHNFQKSFPFLRAPFQIRYPFLWEEFIHMTSNLS